MQQRDINTPATTQGPETEGVNPTDVYDHCTQAREVLQWMEALAGAISDASANETRGPHQAKRLAGLMHYLATDWGNHFDCAAEQIAKEYGLNHAQ